MSPTGLRHDDPAARIDELESLQDEVLAELDRLNDRIESMLRNYGAGEPRDQAA